MSIENLEQKFDTNNNDKLDKQDIENLTWIQLNSLKEDVIDSKLNELAPNYEKDLKKLSLKEKEVYLILFAYAKKILWEEFYNEFLSKNWDYKDVPFNEMINFLSELLWNEQNKELLQTKEIILTTDELKELHKILTNKETREKLQDFIKEQLNEDITSAEIIQWTSFAKKIEDLWENPYKFMKNIDTVWFTYLESNLKNISKDTLRNMATWMTFTFIKLFTETNWKIPQFLKNIKDPKKLLEKIHIDEWKSFFEKTNLLIKAIKDIEKNKNWEENWILMDPQKFSEFYYNILTWEITEGGIKNKLQTESEKYKPEDRKIDELKKIANNASRYITKENLKKAWGLAWLWAMIDKLKSEGKEFKNYMKKEALNHADDIFKVKDFFKEMGIFKYIKDLFDKFFKLVWFKDGWDEFEKKAQSKDFPKITAYFKDLKDNLTPEFLTTENWKKTIFYAWFGKYLNWDKKDNITKIKVKWKLSHESFEYLNNIWWEKVKENLNNFFTSENFDKLFENEDEKNNFYKNAFKIEQEEIEKNDKKIKTNIWIIDFNEIDKIIKKSSEKENKNNIRITNTETYPVNIKSLDNIKITEKDKNLLDFIWKYESRNNYNAVYWNPKQNKIDFTKMNIEQVIENRKQAVKNDSPSSAVWRYQFLTKTLEDLIKKYKINPKTTNFTPTVQDKLALLKAKERWWDKFLQWNITLEQFIYNLSQEWAFIPKDISWESFYKDWLNKVHISYNDTYNTLNEIKNSLDLISNNIRIWV